MFAIIVRVVINAAALVAASRFIEGVSTPGGGADLLIVAAVFGVLNALIRPALGLFGVEAGVFVSGVLSFLVNAGLFQALQGRIQVADGRALLTGAAFMTVVSLVALLMERSSAQVPGIEPLTVRPVQRTATATPPPSADRSAGIAPSEALPGPDAASDGAPEGAGPVGDAQSTDQSPGSTSA